MSFAKGSSGNPAGRPRGVPSPQAKIRTAMGEKLSEILEILTQKALGGDMQAISLIISRGVGPAKAESNSSASNEATAWLLAQREVTA